MVGIDSLNIVLNLYSRISQKSVLGRAFSAAFSLEVRFKNPQSAAQSKEGTAQPVFILKSHFLSIAVPHPAFEEKPPQRICLWSSAGLGCIVLGHNAGDWLEPNAQIKRHALLPSGWRLSSRWGQYLGMHRQIGPPYAYQSGRRRILLAV